MIKFDDMDCWDSVKVTFDSTNGLCLDVLELNVNGRLYDFLELDNCPLIWFDEKKDGGDQYCYQKTSSKTKIMKTETICSAKKQAEGNTKPIFTDKCE
jgi:hypothetical protein